MAGSPGETQLRLVILFLVCSTTVFGIYITDQIDCTDVQCPNIDCPSDSVVRIMQPVVLLQDGPLHSGNTSTVERNRRDLPTNATTELTAETTTESVQHTTTEELIETTSQVKKSIGLTERCCPKADCVCKELCNIPSCHNTSLVLLEIKQGLNTPGTCCAEYQCSFEPDCNKVFQTEGSWLIDCQTCRCFLGQKICHRSCDEIRPQPANCFSQNLKRSFSNGETWKEDECTQCECHNGDKKCLTSFCKALNCANKFKLTGECCPICADSVEPETTAFPTTKTPTTSITLAPTTVRPIVVEPRPQSPCDENQRIVHVIELSNEKCILYGIMAFLFVLAAVFIGLYCHVRSKQRSYRPVPIFDSNFNKIKSIVTS